MGSALSLQTGVFSGLHGTAVSGGAGGSSSRRFALKQVTAPAPANPGDTCTDDCKIVIVVAARVGGEVVQDGDVLRSACTLFFSDSATSQGTELPPEEVQVCPGNTYVRRRNSVGEPGVSGVLWFQT